MNLGIYIVKMQHPSAKTMGFSTLLENRSIPTVTSESASHTHQHSPFYSSAVSFQVDRHTHSSPWYSDSRSHSYHCWCCTHQYLKMSLKLRRVLILCAHVYCALRYYVRKDMFLLSLYLDLYKHV